MTAAGPVGKARSVVGARPPSPPSPTPCPPLPICPHPRAGCRPSLALLGHGLPHATRDEVGLGHAVAGGFQRRSLLRGGFSARTRRAHTWAPDRPAGRSRRSESDRSQHETARRAAMSRVRSPRVALGGLAPPRLLPALRGLGRTAGPVESRGFCDMTYY